MATHPLNTSIISQPIGDLEQHAFVVEATLSGKAVVDKLEQHTYLPGVIIMERKNRFVGMISRHRCFEQLGRPYGVEVYLNRPISMLYKALALSPTLLAAETSIEEAVRLCLTRPGSEAYEPVVVKHQASDYRLLDFHTLLTAHSKSLGEANRLIRQQNEIGRALASTLELEDVLNIILRHMHTLVPYHRAGILLEENQSLKFVAHRGFPAEADFDTMRINLQHDALYPKLCQTRQPLAVNDVADLPGWQHFEPLEPTRSWAGVPLVHRDKPLGMISLARVTVRPFTANELMMAQSLARQAAVALHNAQLFWQVKQFTKTLEDTVQERTQQLREAYRQLTQLDRAKSDFIDVASHELRTPLTVVSGYLQMLSNQPAIQSEPYLKEVVAGAYVGIHRMQDIVNSMVDVARIDNHQLNLQLVPISLAWLAAELRREFAPKATARNLHLDIPNWDDQPVVWADGEALRKVFQNLLYNAIKYTPDGGRIALWSRPASLPQSGQPAVDVVVEDTGVGIAPEHLNLIFGKFFVTGKVSLHSSSKTKFKGGGPGLGLTIARGIVEALGGRIWAESPGYDEVQLPGSRFYVTLRLAEPEEALRGAPTAATALIV